MLDRYIVRAVNKEIWTGELLKLHRSMIACVGNSLQVA